MSMVGKMTSAHRVQLCPGLLATGKGNKGHICPRVPWELSKLLVTLSSRPHTVAMTCTGIKLLSCNRVHISFPRINPGLSEHIFKTSFIIHNTVWDSGTEWLGAPGQVPHAWKDSTFLGPIFSRPTVTLFLPPRRGLSISQMSTNTLHSLSFNLFGISEMLRVKHIFSGNYFLIAWGQKGKGGAGHLAGYLFEADTPQATSWGSDSNWLLAFSGKTDV